MFAFCLLLRHTSQHQQEYEQQPIDLLSFGSIFKVASSPLASSLVRGVDYNLSIAARVKQSIGFIFWNEFNMSDKRWRCYKLVVL